MTNKSEVTNNGILL